EDWNTDTHRLRENAEFIDDFVALLERIEKQQLAEYKQQFKKYLNEEMITKMSDFQTWLERQEEEIEENVELLNRSLGKINFRQLPRTFISLQSEKDYSPKVKDFKIKLNEWKPNLVEFERTKDDMILEESFNKIKALLDQLTVDENSRKEVLDVRNWLKFKAVELHKEDPTKPFRSYTGTAKLSGGEGAQLTYTILSSAIAYQFGIHSEGLNTNSFRFICVDEAFSKQDDEKAKFLMELCKQLHLQLMVVSPAKAEEVAIVEPYIARVHFVQRKNHRNSVVFDMPIKQLQEHRQQYLQSV
ncbi:MAG: SbcC/MukB-like Walker B domain-containing protein, partial [Bacteroidota bacterium]